jgi:hypothetical protein
MHACADTAHTHTHTPSFICVMAASDITACMNPLSIHTYIHTWQHRTSFPIPRPQARRGPWRRRLSRAGAEPQPLRRHAWRFMHHRHNVGHQPHGIDSRHRQAANVQSQRVSSQCRPGRLNSWQLHINHGRNTVFSRA